MSHPTESGSESDNEIFLSIVIPTWNRTTTIDRLLQSIVVPNGVSFEIVVIDNNSIEEKFKELTSICARYAGTRLLQNDSNIGMVPNWNRCLELARGKWIGFICSDDSYREGAIARAIGLLQKLDKDCLVIQDPTIQSDIESCSAGVETVRSLRLPLASGNFWSRAIVKEVGGFDPRFKYSADGEYWYRIAAKFPVVKVRDEFAHYEAHDNNFAYTTWLKDDFLEQAALLTKANLQHSGLSDGPGTVQQDLILNGVRSTVKTVISSIRFNRTGAQIYFMYARKGFAIEKSLKGKAIFLIWLAYRSTRLMGAFLKAKLTGKR